MCNGCLLISKFKTSQILNYILIVFSSLKSKVNIFISPYVDHINKQFLLCLVFLRSFFFYMHGNHMYFYSKLSSQFPNCCKRINFSIISLYCYIFVICGCTLALTVVDWLLMNFGVKKKKITQQRQII